MTHNAHAHARRMMYHAIASLAAVPAPLLRCSSARVRRRQPPLLLPARATTREVEDARMRHTRTLHALQLDGSKLRWRDLSALLVSLGGSVNHSHVRLGSGALELKEQQQHGARTPMHDRAFATPKDLRALRGLLTEAGALGGSGEGGRDNNAAPETCLVEISHDEAAIYEAPFASGSVPAKVLHPAATDAHHHLHVRKGVTPLVKGDYAPPSGATRAAPARSSAVAARAPASSLPLWQ